MPEGCWVSTYVARNVCQNVKSIVAGFAELCCCHRGQSSAFGAACPTAAMLRHIILTMQVWRERTSNPHFLSVTERYTCQAGTPRSHRLTRFGLLRCHGLHIPRGICYKEYWSLAPQHPLVTLTGGKA